MTVSFVQAFIVVLLGNPEKTSKMSKWGLSLALFFSKIYCCDFLYNAALAAIDIRVPHFAQFLALAFADRGIFVFI